MHRIRCRVSRRRAFTLVEMLVVVVIIGILAGLITGAAIMARNAARVSIMRTEVSQLEMALQQYKTQYGEYPPDFAFTDPSVVDPLRIAARQRVLQHIRKRWPRVVIPGNTVDQQWGNFVAALNAAYDSQGNNNDADDAIVFNPATFTPASALLFWLGGLPEDPAATEWKPQGFHSDPTNPFQAGLPREQPLFNFKQERIFFQGGDLRYQPQRQSISSAPYVYFRSYRLPQTMRYEYGYSTGPAIEVLRWADSGRPEYGVAVPYLEPWAGMPDPTTSNDGAYTSITLDRRWRSDESFQIVSPGLDGFFGIGLDVPAGPGNPSLFRFTKIGARFSDEDYDNIANFSQGTLQDEIE